MKPYPIEGMEWGIKIGGVIGFTVGSGLWFYWSGYHFMRTGLLVAGGCALIGAFFGFLLGALSDKVSGKWKS